MLLVSILIVGLAVLLAAPLAKGLGRNAGWVLWVPLAGAAALLSAEWFGAEGSLTESYPWIPGLGVGLHLHLTGLSYLFSMIVLVIGAAVLFYSARYLGSKKIISFYLLMCLFALAMLLLVLADDLVVLYVAWEATTLTSFFLIARSGALARQPAIRTLLVTVAGGLCLLTAVCVMIIDSGTTRISEVLASDMWQDPVLAAMLAVLLGTAALTKSAQFPFQAWLPDSMVAISPVSAYLHAAAMVKAGIFLLLLFSSALSTVLTWNILLIAAGGITALFGAVAAVRRYDLKELLAYSTMSQLGLLVMLIGIGTATALQAAVVHTIAHALFKSALFMAVGTLDHEAGTRDMRLLAHQKLRTGSTHLAIILGATSMAGLPPLLGFVSKESMFEASLDAPWGGGIGVLLTAWIAVTSVFTLTYSGRLVIGALGKYRPAPNSPRAQAPDASAPRVVTEAPVTFWIIPWMLAAAGVVLGLAPMLLDTLATDAVTIVSNAGADVHLALWHGVNAPLLISASVFLAGGLLIWQRRRVEEALVPRGMKISGLRAVENIRTAMIEVGVRVGGWTPGQNPGLHLIVLCACLPVLALVGVFALGPLPEVVGETAQPLDWLLVTLVAAGVLTTVRAKTRISAVVVVGVVGFGVTLWFFALGSVDVALTQLLVEILTVCVMVLLLKRLPARFDTERRGRAIPAAVIAVGAGLAAGLGVWALTGRRDISEPALYFLQHGEETTGGANIVNTILVEFRALDTLGELTVLGVAGLAVAALLASRDPDSVRQTPVNMKSVLADAVPNSVYIRTFTKVAAPLMFVFSLVTLVRGHNEPGGGFISALIGGAAFALLYIGALDDESAPIRWPYLTLIGAGIVTGSGIGLVGLVKGSFLTPLHTELFGIHLNSALIFDVGVYLAVLGVILAAFNLLGRERPGRHGVWGSSSPPVPEDNPRTGAIPVIYQDALNQSRHESLMMTANRQRGDAATEQQHTPGKGES
ncbi:DUF4040 family protein [Citricoccus sp. NR2]|uniref:DUF4040 family protein n=1 Tax=Citricoccus sp. NR2 TaxID=3004095 RepID=UPI0022DD1126|nr:DUF4040 family protein [Citricoccus sp. NR2]WBL18353.1 DUF4040 family protein [Citricoccus sp. NR2]